MGVPVIPNPWFTLVRRWQFTEAPKCLLQSHLTILPNEGILYNRYRSDNATRNLSDHVVEKRLCQQKRSLCQRFASFSILTVNQRRRVTQIAGVTVQGFVSVSEYVDIASKLDKAILRHPGRIRMLEDIKFFYGFDPRAVIQKNSILREKWKTFRAHSCHWQRRAAIDYHIRSGAACLPKGQNISRL